MMFRYTIIPLIVILILVTLSWSKPSPNHELLKKLGMQRVRSPNSHHRKRLAVESRHHARSDDSKMFIIKLPPNPHYYAINKPPNAIDLPAKNVPFKSNGKPGKVYHWNIPVIKKMVSSKLKSRTNDMPQIDFQNPESWNEVLDKPENSKPHKPYYYVPAKPKKTQFRKYFPGNGKPHSFYVIEKSKKPHYHRLLP